MHIHQEPSMGLGPVNFKTEKVFSEKVEGLYKMRTNRRHHFLCGLFDHYVGNKTVTAFLNQITCLYCQNSFDIRVRIEYRRYGLFKLPGICFTRAL